jgi:glycosyltransferase involved in cell wall biosynthesis
MPTQTPARVLYVEGNPDGTVGGSYFSLLFLVRGLDRTRYQPTVVFAAPNPLQPRFHEAGIETRIVPPGRPLVLPGGPLGRLLAKGPNFVRGFVTEPRTLARLLRDERIDLLHLNNSITRNHGWMTAARLAGVPCLTHERGINPTFSRRSRVLARRLGAVVCISDAVRANFVRAGLGDLPLVTIPNGLDPADMVAKRSRADVLAELGVPAERTVAGIVGNIRRWKGQEVVVRALGRLREEAPELVLLLIGDTARDDAAYRRSLDALIRDLKLEQRVVITGYRPDVAECVNALDVMIHASTDPEPFGRVLLEGMALRKPLVASRGGAVPEIVVDGETGLLFEPGQPEDLARALSALVRDPARRAAMGEAGYRRLVGEFGLARNVERTQDLYRTLGFG